MTQVAGIQAVNAEGKVIGTLSVDDLTELVATKIVQEAKNEAVSARSASVMSEASTIAATDEYEDQLELDTNPAYVRSLDSEGNPKRTATTSLATVVGELIGTATSDKDGLMGRHYAIRRIVAEGGSGRYFMFKLSGYRAYGTFEFIANTDDGRMLLCTVTFSGFTGSPIKPALIKNKEFYGHLKFYRKEGDNRTFYFQLYTGSNATSLFIRCLTANNYVADVESSDEPAESLIEIPMS